MASLLLVDDDAEVLELNSKYLTKEGYSVTFTSSPIESIQLAKDIHPDCILLDVMMPELDGLEVLKKIRSFSSCPVIFLTGKGDEDDRINGLLIGADDYIVKPYSLRELKARIEVLLRRSTKGSQTQTSQPKNNRLVIRELTIDRLAHKAFYKNEDLYLTNREYDLLLYLATHPNREITFQELGEFMFGVYTNEDRRMVMVNISRLRKKFGSHYELANMIETVWSKGYRFLA